MRALCYYEHGLGIADCYCLLLLPTAIAIAIA
jgi:hypothetical protein